MRLIILLLFFTNIAYSQIIGGAGICHVSGNPNAINKLENLTNQDCKVAIDSVTNNVYIYKYNLPVGSRWELLSSVNDFYFSNDTIYLVTPDTTYGVYIASQLNGEVNGSLSNTTVDTVRRIWFDRTYTAPDSIGKLQWNSEYGTLDLGMEFGDVIQQIGQELYYVPVINKTASTILNGTLVMIDTTQVVQGDRLRIIPAVNNGVFPSDYIVGVATMDILVDQLGLITFFGEVTNLVESEFVQTGISVSVGDLLYPSITQAGKFTNIKPAAPYWNVPLAVVKRKPNVNNITILTRWQKSIPVSQLQDVSLDSLTQGSVLRYYNGVWQASALAGLTSEVDGDITNEGRLSTAVQLAPNWVNINTNTSGSNPVSVLGNGTTGVLINGTTDTNGGVITVSNDTTVLSTKAFVNSKVDSTRLVADSILVYYIGGVEVGRDTINIPPAGVTSITAGVGLTGGTITSTGTIAADTSVLSTKWFVGSKVDSTRLVQDSILVYYIGGVELRRDTISGVGGGGGTMSSFTLAGSAGTPQTITDGNTLTIAAGVGISTTAVATDQVTVAADTTTVLASKTFLSTRGYTTGSGTTGTIPIWSSSTALGNSALTEASGSVTAGGTGFFRLPNGTTAERPGTPAAGMTRYNSTNGALEYYGASAWEVPLRSATATGLGTAGRVFYGDANGRSASADSLHWDNTNRRLGINKSVPAAGLHLRTNASSNAIIIEDHNTATAGPAMFITGDNQTTAGSNASEFSITVAGPGSQALNQGPQVLLRGNEFTRFANERGALFLYSGFPTTPLNGFDGTANFGALNYIDFATSTNLISRLRITSDGSIGIGNTNPQRTLHVTGEVRITDLTTDPPTRIVGADTDGDLGAITIGTGLTLSSGTLSASGTGTTNLTFSGTSSPITLNSDTGTDVTFSNGVGVSLSQATNNLTINTDTTTLATRNFVTGQGYTTNTGTVTSVATGIGLTGGTITTTGTLSADTTVLSSKTWVNTRGYLRGGFSGLTKAGDSLRLGGTLSESAVISITGAHNFAVTRISSGTTFSVTGSTGATAGIISTMLSGGPAVYALAANNSAIGLKVATSTVAAKVAEYSATVDTTTVKEMSTNAINPPSGQTPGVGFGIKHKFEFSNGSSLYESAAIVNKLLDVATKKTSLELSTRENDAIVTPFKLEGSDVIFTNYGSGNKQDVITYNIGVTSAGKVVEDKISYGEAFVNIPPTVSVSSMFDTIPSLVLGDTANFIMEGSALKYIGTTTKRFVINLSFSGSYNDTDNIFIRVRKNSTGVIKSRNYAKFTSGDVNNVSTNAIIELATNDKLLIEFASSTTSGTLTVNNLNFTISQL